MSRIWNDYKGAVLIISHDRHLIEATCDTLWIAENGTVREFEDDLDGYQKSLTANGASGAGGGGSASDRKRERQEAAAKRAELAPLRKEIKALEQKLDWKRKDLAKIDKQLDDPGLYTGDADKAIALGIEKSKFESEIAALEDQWLEKSAELEDAQADA